MAKSSFLSGDQWAYLAAMIAVLIGLTLVFHFFPEKEQEEALRASYHAHDQGEAPEAGAELPSLHVPAPGEEPAQVPGHVPAPGETAARVPGHVSAPKGEP